MIVDAGAAAELLRRGGLVAYPTETVYGLGADPGSDEAVSRLLALKGRSASRGLSILVSDSDWLERQVPDLPRLARDLARRFWPGPLTLVVPAPGSSFARVRTSRGVGIRCSPHPVARALARAFGGPLVATSCNLSGEPPCRTEDEVKRAFGPELSVVHGGSSGGELPSTVVAVAAGDSLTLLREGALRWRAICEVVA